MAKVLFRRLRRPHAKPAKSAK